MALETTSSSTHDSSLLAMVARAADLAAAGPERASFAEQLVALLAGQSGATAAALWWMDNGRPKRITAGPERHTLGDGAESESAAEALRSQNFSSNVTVRPASSAGRSVVSTAADLGDGQALVQLLVDSNIPPNEAVQKGRALRLVAHAAGQYTRAKEQSSAEHSFHRSLRLKDTCYAIANDTRRLVEADRVTALVRKGRHHQVVATSGVAEVATRSNVIRAMQALTEAALTLTDAFQFPGTNELPPQLEQALELYIEQSDAKALNVVALRDTTRRPVAEENPERVRSGPVIGAIFVEEFHESSLQPKAARISALAAEAEVALSNATTHQRVFLLPLWTTLGTLVSRAHLSKTLLVLAAFLASALALTWVPANYYVPAEGTLEPSNRQHVYARTDGTVTSIDVQHGQRVAAGDVLLRLENREIERQIDEVRGEIITTRRQLQSVQSMMLGGESIVDNDPATSSSRLAAEEQQLALKLEHLESQQTLIMSKQQALAVSSSVGGEVLTWDLRRRLAQRPVNRGQLLLTVADTEGPWQLELQVRDRHAGELLEAYAAQEQPLKVSFLLGTHPEKRFMATVTKIAEAAQEHESLGSTLLVVTNIGEETLPELHAGAEVRAKIYCGRRALGYVWFRDVIAFLRSRVWFRLR